MDVPSDWWQKFFHGVAVDMWLQAIPPEHTRREAAERPWFKAGSVTRASHTLTLVGTRA